MSSVRGGGGFPPSGSTVPQQAIEVGFQGELRNFLWDNSFIIREVSLARNLGPGTESLSYGLGVGHWQYRVCVYSGLPPGPAPSGHVAVCVCVSVSL